MSFLVLHSQDHPALAREEVASLFPDAIGKGTVSIIKRSNPDLLARLAYSRMAIRILWHGYTRDFWKTTLPDLRKRFGPGSFAVRFLSVEKGLVSGTQAISKVAQACKGRKVNLDRPKNILWCIFTGPETFIGEEIWNNDGRFESRKNHLREAPHPVSVHPKLARAMVNLTGAKSGSTIFDPLCGTGGFLIEAGLMHLTPKGQDIDPKMVDMSRRNLMALRIPLDLEAKDVFDTKVKFPYIVTDPPYGKNTMLMGGVSFYPSLISKLSELTKKVLVISFPHWYDPTPAFRKASLSVKFHYPIYIHRSLTKELYVLEKKR